MGIASDPEVRFPNLLDRRTVMLERAEQVSQLNRNSFAICGRVCKVHPRNLPIR
jgi:hypothetical protein